MTPAVPEQRCPRCGRGNRAPARFCAGCGEAMQADAAPRGIPGRSPHARPLPTPAGFEACRDAVDLFVCWRHGNEPPTLGAEAVTVDVFNAGHDLRGVTLRMVGLGAMDATLCDTERMIPELPRGATARIEVPSYELSNQIQRLVVSLASADWRVG